MDSCCATDLESAFGARDIADDLAAYRRGGLGADQRRLLAALVADGVEGKTVLDIGGGIGAIHHDLLRAGASGPGYVHAESDIDAVVRQAGFTPVMSDATWFWRIALYRREGPASA